MKLAIRQDDESNLVRAYFSVMDDTERFEVATISLKMMQDYPAAFEAWKGLLTDIMKNTLTDAGLTVSSVVETKLHEKC